MLSEPNNDVLNPVEPFLRSDRMPVASAPR